MTPPQSERLGSGHPPQTQTDPVRQLLQDELFRLVQVHLSFMTFPVNLRLENIGLDAITFSWYPCFSCSRSTSWASCRWWARPSQTCRCLKPTCISLMWIYLHSISLSPSLLPRMPNTLHVMIPPSQHELPGLKELITARMMTNILWMWTLDLLSIQIMRWKRETNPSKLR